MNLLIKISIFYFIVLIHVGCSTPIEVSNRVEVEFQNDPMYLDVEFGRIKFHKFETNNNTIVRYIKDVIFKNDTVYVFSDYPDNLVAIHSKNGQYLTHISAIGRGPGEFKELKNIQVDSLVRLTDASNRKMINYRSNGQFVDEVKFDSYIQSAMKINDTLIATLKSVSTFEDTNNKYNFNLYNKGSNMGINLFPIDNRRSKFQKIRIGDCFYKYNSDSVALWNFGNDTIYNIHINNLKINKFIYLDFGPHRLPKELPHYNFKGPKEFYKYINEQGFAYLVSYANLENQHIFSLSYSELSYWGKCSNSDNKVDTYNHMSFSFLKEQFSASFRKEVKWVGQTENSVLFTISSSKFIEFHEKTKLMQSDKTKLSKFIDFSELEKVATDYTLENNPVILELFINP